MFKDIGRIYKYNWPKRFTTTFKKPLLSSSADHASSASNSTVTNIASQLHNKDITKNQNKNNTSNTDDIHLCVTQTKQNYSVHSTSTITPLTPLDTALPIVPVELHKTKQLPPADKEYFCFNINRRSSYAAQCVKSRIMKNAIDSIIYIDRFEQQCVLIKGMLQSPRLEDHMKTIGIDQSLCNRYFFKQKCLNNIKKIYQHTGKCDNQQNLKGIIDAAMI